MEIQEFLLVLCGPWMLYCPGRGGKHITINGFPEVPRIRLFGMLRTVLIDLVLSSGPSENTSCMLLHPVRIGVVGCDEH